VTQENEQKPTKEAIADKGAKLAAYMKKTAGKTQEKFEKAYDVMLSRVKEQLEDVSKKAEPKVGEFVSKAKVKAIQLGELTEEEAEKVGEYLMRDLHEAADFLKDAKKVLADWLYFDYKLVEQKFWETYKAVAKQAKEEWVEFNQRLKHAKEYNTGEVIGVGTLECTGCKEVLHFTRSSTIPKCPKCGGASFVRKKG